MNDGIVAERPSKLNRRATGYLRWYPSAWRVRYGEEFVAHLEAELEERPLSYIRGINIVLHGITARFRLERSFRWITGIGLSVVVAVALIVGVLASEVKYPALPLSMQNEGGAGIPTWPKTVNNFNFRFTNHSHTRIRLLHVSLVGYKDYPVPLIVRVELDVHHQKELGLNLPSTTPGLVPAIGRTVVLGNDDSIVVSMVAPLRGRLYGVVGLTLKYAHNGVDHTVTTPQNLDLLCVEPRPSESLTSPYCNRDFTTVFSLWSFDHLKTPFKTQAKSEAMVVTNAALSFTGAEHRSPSTSDVREWATQLFDHRGPWKILRATTTTGNVPLVNAKHELVFHFDLMKRGTGERTTVCVQNGAYDSGGGEVSPELVACPKP
jgi:hypothetical protein